MIYNFLSLSFNSHKAVLLLSYFNFSIASLYSTHLYSLCSLESFISKFFIFTANVYSGITYILSPQVYSPVILITGIVDSESNCFISSSFMIIDVSSFTYLITVSIGVSLFSPPPDINCQIG